MKVILTAFCGKLRSEPMDWPDNTPPNIYMRMSMGLPGINYDSDLERATKIISKKGRFESTGRWFPLGGGESAQEYVLVDIS